MIPVIFQRGFFPVEFHRDDAGVSNLFGARIGYNGFLKGATPEDARPDLKMTIAAQ